jgi:hypothetical protein
MYHKNIAGTSGASSAQHEQSAHESTSQPPHSTPPAGAHSVRTTDSRLSGLPSPRRGPLPWASREIESEGESDGDESDTSTLFHGAPSSRFGSSRMRMALETDFPSMRMTVPEEQPAVAHGYTQAETPAAPGGVARSLTASLQHAYGTAAAFGARAKDIAASGLTVAKDGVVATAQGGGRVLGAGLRHAAEAGTSAVSGLSVVGVEPRMLGAAAGHLIHQAAATGVPTFAREMMYEALFAALRHLPQPAITALQVTTSVATLGLNRMRQVREQRNPQAAARGFHNLSVQDWEALPDEEKHAKMAEQRKYSDAVTTLAMGAAITNVMLGQFGHTIGQPHLGAQVLASDLKVLAYAAARDSIQASFRMVNTEAETNGGVSGAHKQASATFYATANFAANYSYAAVPAGLSEARTKLAATFGDKGAQAALAAHPSPLSMGQALGTVAHSSLVKATINTLLETADWIHVTQQEANEAGTRQRFDPAVTGTDRQRVLDQSVTRSAVIDSNIALGNALGALATRFDAQPWMNALLTNGAPAIFAGVTYGMIAGTWQAESAVRSLEDHPSSSNTAMQETAAETEAPHGDGNV